MVASSVVETIADWAERGTVAFTILAAASGLVFVVASRQVKRLEAIRAEAKDTRANERAAKLELDVATQQERAAKAETTLLELQRQVARRTVDRKVFLAALEGQPKAKVEILYLRDDSECMELAQQIGQLLREAKWEVTGWLPIPPGSPDLPTAMSSGGQPSGVCVVTHSATEEEADAGMNKFAGKPWVHTPWTVLSDAIVEAIGKGSSHAGGASTPPKGMLRIVVAPRM